MEQGGAGQQEDDDEKRWRGKTEKREGRSEAMKKRGGGGKENYEGTVTAERLKRDEIGLTVHGDTKNKINLRQIVTCCSRYFYYIGQNSGVGKRAVRIISGIS